MIRARIRLIIGVLLLSGAHAVAAAESVARILVLMSQDAEPYDKALAGFRDQLQSRGVAASYDVVRLHGDADLASKTLASPVAPSANIILSLGSVAVQAPRPAELKTPTVAALVMTAREFETTPNTTGVVLEFPVQTELEWLSRFMPGRKNIAVIYNLEENQQRVNIAITVAAKLGMTLHAQSVATPRDLPAKLEDIGRDADVIWGIPDHVVMTPQSAKPILLYSFRNRIPLTGLSTAWVKAGALYALDRDYFDIGAQAAELAQKIINGAGAESIVPVVPRKIVYAINLKTARQMKLDIPPDLVNRAAEVIE